MGGDKSKVDSGGGASGRVVSAMLDNLVEGEEIGDSNNLITKWGRERVVDIQIPKKN